MFRDMAFYGRDPNVVARAADSTFRNPLKWAKSGKQLAAGSRIFTCSWSDWFIEEADKWRDEAWAIIKATPQFNYLILTKRPERIREHLPKDWGEGYSNVWLLASAEDQERLHERWDYMRDLPAKIKGISAEPLLSQISLGSTMRPDWVITGGESDKQSPRPMDKEWVRFLRDQCNELHIPFFHKQHGGSKKINGTWGGRELDGKTWDQFPLSEQKE
jgi:protein gp37